MTPRPNIKTIPIVNGYWTHKLLPYNYCWMIDIDNHSVNILIYIKSLDFRVLKTDGLTFLKFKQIIIV